MSTHRVSAASSATIENFDNLPDSARVDMAAFQRLASTSRATAYRWIEAGILPKPRRIGFQKVFWSAGEIRAFLNGGAAA